MQKQKACSKNFKLSKFESTTIIDEHKYWVIVIELEDGQVYKNRILHFCKIVVTEAMIYEKSFGFAYESIFSCLNCELAVFKNCLTIALGHHQEISQSCNQRNKNLKLNIIIPSTERLEESHVVLKYRSQALKCFPNVN